MSSLRVRDLVFDLGGVLIDWDPVYLYRDHLGTQLDDVNHLLANVCTLDWHAQLDRGLGFTAATAELSVQHPELAQQIHHWDTGWPQMFKGAFPGVDALLAGLQADGYRLHALSNYPAEKLDFLYDRFEFMQRFHSVMISGLLTTAKPDAAIFDYLVRLLDNRPCIFFDDREENVAAAIRAGLEAHRCEPRGNIGAALAKAIGRSTE